MEASTIRGLVGPVAQYLLDNDNDRDIWERAMALTGMIDWGDEANIKGADKMMDRIIALQNTEGNLTSNDPLEGLKGHLTTFTPTAPLTASFGYPILRRYQETGNEKYLEACDLQIQALMNTPRVSNGGFWFRKEAPELWIDGIYMYVPFMVLYGIIKQDKTYAEEGVAQYRACVERLVDPHTGLGRHAWCAEPNHFTQSTFWARGNGWLAAASLDLYEMMDESEDREFIAKTGMRCLRKMMEYQDRSGYLPNVLDMPGAKKEASSTLMLAYSIAKAVRLGLMEKGEMDRAWRAFNIVAATVDENGMVPGVVVPPGGPGVPYGWTPFGQGFFLQAAHELTVKAA